MTYAIVEATVRNVGFNGVGDYGSFAWVLKDNAGEEYFALLGPTHRPLIEGQPLLEQGVTVSTRLQFEIPGTAEGLRLIYDAPPLQDVGSRIVVNLGG